MAYLPHVDSEVVDNSTKCATLLNGVAVACVLVTLAWREITAPASCPGPVPVQIEICAICKIACHRVGCVRCAYTCQAHLHLEHPVTCYPAGRNWPASVLRPQLLSMLLYIQSVVGVDLECKHLCTPH
jgi:hypothetical protein